MPVLRPHYHYCFLLFLTSYYHYYILNTTYSILHLSIQRVCVLLQPQPLGRTPISSFLCHRPGCPRLLQQGLHHRYVTHQLVEFQSEVEACLRLRHAGGGWRGAGAGCARCGGV